MLINYTITDQKNEKYSFNVEIGDSLYWVNIDWTYKSTKYR
jgi:hypothetical protein